MRARLARNMENAHPMTEQRPACVAILIGKPGAGALHQGFIDAATSRLAAHLPSRPGDPPLGTTCLSRGNAYEVHFPGAHNLDPLRLRADLEALAGAPAFDLAILPAEHRRKKLLVADMESTIIQQECLDELADYLGMRERVAAITDRAMRGDLDFAAALRERVSLLKGLDAEALAEVYRERVTLTPGAQTLIATMRAHGALCALVSGGFSFFTERIAARLKFDVHQANRLDISAGRIAGTVGEPILGAQAKLAALRRLSKAQALPKQLTMAVGDGANDLAMIKAAGLGVAFRARPIVAREAVASIVHGDLSALLYLQGYSDREFTTLP
jgi:phosphoserine phosphatase